MEKESDDFWDLRGCLPCGFGQLYKAIDGDLRI